jgi:hypothetical protein
MAEPASSMRISPFTPGQPVPFDYFVGRAAEIGGLRTMAVTAVSGRLQVGFIRGERGIGKTSLAAYARTAAEREQGLLGVHVFLGEVTTLPEMARRVFERVLKTAENTPWYEKMSSLFGNHIRKVSLFQIGVEFAPPPSELEHVVQHFAESLRSVLEKMKEHKNGMFLVLDEIDALASTPQFAQWLKSLIDEIATGSQPLPLCLVLVGLEEHRRGMIDAHASLARVFDIIELKTWTRAETTAFFAESFEKVGISVDDAAMNTLSVFASGFPVLAHEIGDAAFRADDDRVISPQDASAAIWQAAETVGKKFLEPQVYAALRSPRYRSIFRRIALETKGVTFRRRDVDKNLSGEEKKVFNNFLRKMKELGVIEPDLESGPGSYAFTNVLHSLYFFVEARQAPPQPPTGDVLGTPPTPPLTE